TLVLLKGLPTDVGEGHDPHSGRQPPEDIVAQDQDTPHEGNERADIEHEGRYQMDHERVRDRVLGSFGFSQRSKRFAQSFNQPLCMAPEIRVADLNGLTTGKWLQRIRKLARLWHSRPID